MARGRYIQKRPDGRWRFVLRVPNDVVADYGSQWIRLSLHTDDEATALQKAKGMVEEYRHAFDDLRDSKGTGAKARYEAARRIARRYGYEYRTIGELVAGGNIEDMLARIATATENPSAAPALTGSVPVPPLLLSGLVAEVERIKRVELAGKSPNQMHRWRLARDRAVRNLITVAGDIPALDIPRPVALDFVDWWRDKLLAEGLKPASLNRDLENLGAMIGVVSRVRRVENPRPFTGLALPAGVASRPHAIMREEVRDRLIPALPSLNKEARAIVSILMQTGLRPSEACNLRAEDIVLDHAIPHVLVQHRTDREIKTANAVRRIPLVGIAFDAAKKYPKGFPRYQDKEATFCATVGKWMREASNGARWSAYGLRHGFQDRVNEAAPPERVNADLMGHRIGRERYGSGPSLAQMLTVMEAVAVR